MGGSANPRLLSRIQSSLEGMGAAAEPLVPWEGCGQINQTMILLQTPGSGCSAGSGAGLELGPRGLVHPICLSGVSVFLQLIFFAILKAGACFPLLLLLIAEGLPVLLWWVFLKVNNGLGLCYVFLRGLVLDAQKKGAGVRQSVLAAQ